ncbi:MAG TPA: hypothetical protein VLB12_16910 [Gemmatimonadales bacterium]|nr:hypothetical protein [Gemmatimonadales bacterium]
MIVDRLEDLLETARRRSAERREREALARAGEALAGAIERDGSALEQLPAGIHRLRRRVDELTEEMSRSLEADRADYARVSRNVRWLVILRGLCTRALLGHERTQCWRDLRPLYEGLGAAAMKRSSAASTTPSVPAAQVEPASPYWVSRVAVEAKLLGNALKRQLRDRLFPRLPALVGLAAGWWVANTYTDSHWKSAMRSVGIGGGGTHVVSGEIYRLMMFGLPILSAAVCAYLADRLAHLVRNRYAPLNQPPPDPLSAAGDTPVAD